MADTKITALTAITTVDPAVDVFPIVDVSDTTMAASGTTKKITSNQLLGAGGTATLASATITGDLTVDTSTLKVDSANNRVGIGTATPDNQLSVRAASISTIDVRGGVGGAGALLISGNGTTLGTTSFDLIQNSSGALVYQRDANPLFFYVNGSERYAISSTGVATWSNVGGVAGTAMTLNSTGLGVGVASPSFKLDVQSSTATFQLKSTTGTNAAYLFTNNTGGDFYFGRDNSTGATFGSGTGYSAILYSAGAYPMAFFTNATERARIDSSGNLLVGVTSANANGGVLQLKSGITFPATQVAASDANTLDDYEEGTFTATLTGGTSNPTTPVTTTARYTKVGRLVTVQIEFVNISNAGASGAIAITGLPFVNGSVAATGIATLYNLATFTGSPVVYLDTGASFLAFYGNVSSSAFSSVTHNSTTSGYSTTTITYSV